MDRLNGVIAEVGLEAAVRLVAANPFVLWQPPGSLARDISVYMEETGWSRGEVVGWMMQPRCAALLTRNAATVISNFKSYAAHLGLAPPRAGLLLLIQKCPAAATCNPKTTITNLDTLQQLQATHPIMWEGQYSRLSPSTKLMLARSGPAMGRLRHVVELGQQDLIPMSAARSQTTSMHKLPGYVAPPPSRAPRLSPEEGEKQLGQYLARWQPWAASWGG